MRTIILTCLSLLFLAKVNAQNTVFYQNAEWSPDGKKIVTEAIIKSGNNLSFNSYIINLNGDVVERKIANSVFPVWSREGKDIAYSKMTGVKNGSDIWMLNVMTGDSMQITNVPSRNTGVSFSPDGKRICFSSDRDGGLKLYMATTDGSNLQPVTTDTFQYYNAVWSPNADEIIYYRERGDNRDKVFMVNLRDKKEVLVTDDTLHDIYPGWLPGGKTVIYTFSDPSVSDRDIRQIAVIDATGKNKKIIPGIIGAFFVRASADGKKIAFTKGGWPQDNIYTANIDGSNIECITCSLKTGNNQ